MQPYEKVHADTLGKHKRAPSKHEIQKREQQEKLIK